MTEHDTTSHISMRPHNLPLDYGSDGPPAGAPDYAVDGVQTSLSIRSTEALALRSIEHPQREADTFSPDELVRDMLNRGYVWCNGRCQTFKHKSEFSVDERNPGRLYCQSFCKECVAGMVHRKRAALHPVQATVRYEYRKRKEKRRKRRKH